MIAIAYCLGRVSRLWCKEGKPKQSPAGFLSCGYEAARPDRPRQLKSANQSTRQKRGPQSLNFGDQQRVPWSIQLVLSIHAYEETVQGLGKEHPKRVRGNSTQHSQRTGNGASSHEPEWKKESRFMGHRVEYTAGSFFNTGE